MNTFNSLNASADDASLLTLAVAAVQSAGLAAFILRSAGSGAFSKQAPVVSL